MNATVIQPNSTRAHIAARSFSAMTSLGERWADVTQVNRAKFYSYLYHLTSRFRPRRPACCHIPAMDTL